MILDYDVTAVSLFGMIAVGGVVVNDTLVLMHRYNKIRAEADIPAVAAVSAAARQRFRAIILTTATTVMGLLPILLVKAEVTANLVPMVVSIVFGLIVASLGILFFVPAVLLLEEQARERLAFRALEPFAVAGHGNERSKVGPCCCGPCRRRHRCCPRSGSRVQTYATKRTSQTPGKGASRRTPASAETSRRWSTPG